MSRKEKTQETPAVESNKISTHAKSWSTVFSWGVTFLLVAALILLLVKFNPLESEASPAETSNNPVEGNVELPNVVAGLPVDSLIRLANIDTTIPEGIRQFPIKYTIEPGDSIFVIAKKYNITPESILWANYDLLKDDPTFIKEGWRITIPPTNGVYYKWKEGDTLQKVAEKYFVTPDDIISWPGNHLDVSNPITDNLEYVMIPGGYRDLVQWIVPLDFSPRSGATRTIPGGCAGPENGSVGTGVFYWPVNQHFLSGFDFTNYHLGIDIAAGVGTPVVASDNGTVIYADWNSSGYGNLVAIDHNNGYKTIYAHLNSIVVPCGVNVAAGQLIGYSGSTGKSTGGHLHFEIRYYNQYLNPWQVGLN